MGTAISPPNVLYRYRPVGAGLIYLLEELAGNLWCAYPEMLNDPFDGASGVLDEEVIRKVHDGSKTLSFKERLRCGVACFTERWDSATMWSHYADGGRGVCLGYDYQLLGQLVDIFNLNAAQGLASSRQAHARLSPVSYVESMPSDSANALEAAFVKSDEWAYEKEWRLALKQIIFNMRATGGVTFSTPLCITQVLLGYRIDRTTEAYLWNQVDVANKLHGTNIQICSARPDKGTRRYVRGGAELGSFSEKSGFWER